MHYHLKKQRQGSDRSGLCISLILPFFDTTLLASYPRNIQPVRRSCRGRLLMDSITPDVSGPVLGKTLSRLLEMGWITEEDIRARALPMDLEELQKHNARLPIYPWKPLSSTIIPKDEDRKKFMLTRLLYFQQH